MTPKDSKCSHDRGEYWESKDKHGTLRDYKSNNPTCTFCKPVEPPIVIGTSGVKKIIGLKPVEHNMDCTALRSSGISKECACNPAPLDGVKRWDVIALIHKVGRTHEECIVEEHENINGRMVLWADHEAALKAEQEAKANVMFLNDKFAEKIQALESALKAKEEEIVSLNKRYNLLNDMHLPVIWANDSLKAQLKDKDARIAYYKSENEKLTQQNNDKDWKLSDKDARIAELEAVLNLGGEGSLLVNQERHLMRLEVALNSAESKLKIARVALENIASGVVYSESRAEKALEEIK